MGKKATAKDVKDVKDVKVTGVKAETPKPIKVTGVKAETPKPVEAKKTPIKEEGVKAETPKPVEAKKAKVEIQVADSMEKAKKLVITPSVPQETVKVENAGSLEDAIKANREKAKEASPVVPATPVPTVTVPQTTKARSAAAAKSYAAKRLAMAMLHPKRGWKETKPGLFEKDAHSVSFHTEGHHVEVDGKLQLALGQGAIKILDKYIEAEIPQIPQTTV